MSERSRWLGLRLGTLALALGLVAVGCSSSEGSQSGTAGTTGSEGTITVSAASSLTEAFTEIADQFEAANPGTKVEANFGSSGTLATQISEGAPVDVAAFAATKPMDGLAADSLLAATPEVFARNSLVIVTKPGNPRGIEGLADLAGAGTVSLCVDTAPCGSFADQVLADAKVDLPESRVTRGQDVKATLAAVAEGDADAAIVYVTDAASAGDAVDTVAIPKDQNAIASYPIAVVADTANRDLAEVFVAYVLSSSGQGVLDAAGFLAP